MQIDLKLNEPGAWPDLSPETTVQTVGESIAMVTVGHRTTGRGRPCVAMRFDLPGGRVVIAQTSVREFLKAADAMRAVYGDV